MHALVVGRFQPLHHGHVGLIEHALADADKVTVAIGSSTEPVSARNPYSYALRRAMVEAVFGDRVRVVGVPDLHDPPNWARHCLELTGPVDAVYGNDEATLALFEAAGVAVVRPGLQNRSEWEGAKIRAGSDLDQVPAAVRAVLEAA